MRDRNKDLELKEEVLAHYGNDKCQCILCGFLDIRALCIDHIAGEGKYTVVKKSGAAFYRWLKEQDYPKGYQTLCMNCNFIKSIENNERRISPEHRLQQKALRERGELEKNKRAYRVQSEAEPVTSYAGVAYFIDYINKMPWYRFTLREIYDDLQLNETKKTLLRATCLKLQRGGAIKRIGSGRYERLVPEVNS